SKCLRTQLLSFDIHANARGSGIPQPQSASLMSFDRKDCSLVNPCPINGLRILCANQTRAFLPKFFIFNSLRTLSNTIVDVHSSPLANCHPSFSLPTDCQVTPNFLKPSRNFCPNLPPPRREGPGPFPLVSRPHFFPATRHSPLATVKSFPWISASPRPT